MGEEKALGGILYWDEGEERVGNMGIKEQVSV